MKLDLMEVIDNLKFSTIKASKIHGLGLFATRSIAKDTMLGTLDGQVIPEVLNNKLALAFEWNALEEDTLLVRPYRTKYSYINHQRTPNLILVGYPIVVTALQDIPKGTELTLDYRKEKLSTNYIETKGKYYL